MRCRVAVRGNGHLARTLKTAFDMKGLLANTEALTPDIVFVAPDILDHTSAGQLEAVHHLFQHEATTGTAWKLLVVVSQVPPGTIQKWAAAFPNRRVFYQVDTLIVNCALARALNPEQIVIGAREPEQALPLVYQEFLHAFNCPVIVTDYASAELAKCAINYALAAQVKLANELAGIARKLGANYPDIEKVLRNDARIGPKAYLKPGQPNQHLNRDVFTLKALLRQRATDGSAEARKAGGHARAAALTPERRKEIARMGVTARWGKPPV